MYEAWKSHQAAQQQIRGEDITPLAAEIYVEVQVPDISGMYAVHYMSVFLMQAHDLP